jgi:hypothetical protein
MPGAKVQRGGQNTGKADWLPLGASWSAGQLCALGVWVRGGKTHQRAIGGRDETTMVVMVTATHNTLNQRNCSRYPPKWT